MNTPDPIKDTQVIELLGQNIIISQLLCAGFEVAKPLRDRGVDLIVYRDQPQFVARPIQLKCYSQEGFSVHQKYSAFPQLLMVYIWHIGREPIIYAMTYAQGVDILQEMGATGRSTWLEKAHYNYNAPSKKLKALMAPFIIEDWARILSK